MFTDPRAWQEVQRNRAPAAHAPNRCLDGQECSKRKITARPDTRASVSSLWHFAQKPDARALHPDASKVIDALASEFNLSSTTSVRVFRGYPRVTAPSAPACDTASSARSPGPLRRGFC